MTDQDVYLPPALVGSTDWAGGRAPAGGSHTGTGTITMRDGKTFAVAHSRAEILQKLGHAGSPGPGSTWVAFDVPNSSSPVVLDTRLVARVA